MGDLYTKNNLVNGLRTKKKSVKIYKINEKEFHVIEKKYFLGFKIKESIQVYDSYDLAEDHIINLKNDHLM